MIKIRLNNLSSMVKKIIFAMTIYEAEERHQNFGMIEQATIILANQDNNQAIAHYELSEDFELQTAMIFGELYRYNEQWKFRAVGQGFDGGLAALAQNYGVEIV